MAQMPEQTTPTVVDSIDSLQFLIRELINQVEPKTLYIDLEGINLSRHGTVSFLTLLVNYGGVHPDHLYLIDIHTLGSAAFNTSSTTLALNNQSKTLKDILESPTQTKVIFDVRNDSDALFSNFGIRLQGVMDLQLMENAARKGNVRGKKMVHGLAKCIKEDSNLSEDQKIKWELAKEEGRRLFAPELGGCYEVFNERPLKKEIKAYCEQDVWFLPHLYKVYRDRLGIGYSEGPNWYKAISSETAKRLEESRSETYEPQGRDKALAPVWETSQYV
ncbi:uncharacterized protein BP5553_10336 [Venustampulla echinocandica]|uniref:3'-5' exonuclease domain-containing protein n=1 Tax=Venustampulla echinocandica TaxID=2656787 RepID=A0A370T9W7_9HELO|nr:uncharacterized protein BP5553_10336 [Venustampulla echinocandica]RDL30458.1 hypothetical protein BP5553_10336 [Venustampulla echinocandica]